MQRLEELEKQLQERKVQAENERKVIAERQGRLSTEIHKVRRTEEAVGEAHEAEGGSATQASQASTEKVESSKGTHATV